MTKAGFASIVGRPNVGKSTLMNGILGQKISITSNKPQTTRHAITGIYTDEDTQIIFLDTPGIHTNMQSALNKQLNRTAMSTITTGDVIIFIVEALRFNKDDEKVLSKLKGIETPVILVINKIDKLQNKEELFPFIAEMSERFPFSDIVPLSAKQAKSADVLLDVIKKYLPEQPFPYSEDEITTVSSAFLAAEVLREKLTRRLNQELPYTIAVEIEEFKIEGNLYRILAAISVERESQKGIVIGKGGATLKEASTQARIDLERLFDAKVFLRAFVKVREGWSDDEKALNALGYKDL
ncbi:GTPase Era [Ignatzschineria cameli]|uniref:GTPase Era n=2 Tax=Ignatzschineria TaxID=112008 RepID=A0A2U2ASB3_9GAMM|nr:GTPase Era [Ignatzschineria cameli]PWD86590.1 GTPase Era [Ignatzschineria cameli]PWD87057.1 GTPase Era [Ignatzschineria cameli]PWD92030.1 GTPase Era [Ignatzschineria cameli]PWD93385.1 GTPase Era [Ignatzschineria cameli]PWD94127.1 GTPase Era [Ignatzschineria cameli]